MQLFIDSGFVCDKAIQYGNSPACEPYMLGAMEDSCTIIDVLILFSTSSHKEDSLISF